jgi:hypothetical protein
MIKVAAIIWLILGPTLAGILVTAIVTVPSLYDRGMMLIPIAVAAGFVLAAPFSAFVAKRIMAELNR